jgi:serine-type D-Ala-D-Ala carboxypeptidase/endopeptidase (penicillin-binding protein 4)
MTLPLPERKGRSRLAKVLRKDRWLVLGVLWVGTLAPAGAADLGAQVAALVAAYEATGPGVAGVCAVDLRTAERVAEVRPDRLFAPASNQKVLTSAFALLRLGAEYQFSTSLHLRGRDLVVTGDFDPTLGDPYIAGEMKTSPYAELDRWATTVRRRVGERIEGDLLLRCVRPKQDFRHPDWPTNQYQRYYAAPVASLNFANNCLGVTFEVGAGKARARVEPGSYLMQVVNRVRPGKSHLWSLRANEDGSRVELVGTARTTTRDPLYVAVDDPPLLLGRVLADRLRRAGVQLGGSVRMIREDVTDLSDDTVLARTLTPLSLAMRRANKRSLNMVAECLFLRAGDGTWKGSAGAMSLALREAFGVGPNEITVRDGSGLSPDNRVTPAGMVKVLAGLARRRDHRVFLESLPVSGVDGSLRTRLKEPDVAGRILAKTGYISHVSCLSGYVLDTKGKPALAFAVLVNNVRSGKGWVAKKLHDDISRVLLTSLTPRN